MNYQLWKKLFRVKVSLDGTGVEDQEKASISGSEGNRKSRIHARRPFVNRGPRAGTGSPKGNKQDEEAANKNNKRNTSITYFIVLSSFISEDKAEEFKAWELYFLGCQGIQRPSACNKQRIIRRRELDATFTLW